MVLLYSCFVLSIFSNLVPAYGQLEYSMELESMAISYKVVFFLNACYLIYFLPFLSHRDHLTIEKYNQIENNKLLINFSILYSILAVATIIIYFNPVISVVASKNWVGNRELVNSEAVYPYSNIVEKLIINFVGYFKMIAILVGLNLIMDPKNKRLGYIVVLAAGICEMLFAVYAASRGMLIFNMIFYFVLFMMYSSKLSLSKRVISLLGISIFLVLIIVFFIEITVSRFSSRAFTSFVYYLGQPPFGLAEEMSDIKTTMLGRFAFGTLFGDEKFPVEYSTWIHAFYTFSGWLYADWGLWGSLFMGLIVDLVIMKIINKKTYMISDLFLILSYFRFLFEGLLTVGRTKSNMILITILTFILLKAVEKNSEFSTKKENTIQAIN